MLAALLGTDNGSASAPLCTKVNAACDNAFVLRAKLGQRKGRQELVGCFQ